MGAGGEHLRWEQHLEQHLEQLEEPQEEELVAWLLLMMELHVMV